MQTEERRIKQDRSTNYDINPRQRCPQCSVSKTCISVVPCAAAGVCVVFGGVYKGGMA